MSKPTSQDEMFDWAQRHNLALVVDFHNEVKRNFQNEIARMNDRLENDRALSAEERTGLESRKNDYINIFEPRLRINTFLMMVSYLEEWLYLIWKRHAPATGLLEAKGSIGRFKPVLKEIGIDLSRSGPWMFLKGCQDVRSCLLHANGRASLNRNPEKVRKFVAQCGDIIRIESDRLVLAGGFLTRFQEAVERLVDSVKAE